MGSLVQSNELLVELFYRFTRSFCGLPEGFRSFDSALLERGQALTYVLEVACFVVTALPGHRSQMPTSTASNEHLCSRLAALGVLLLRLVKLLNSLLLLSALLRYSFDQKGIDSDLDRLSPTNPAGRHHDEGSFH